MTVLTIITGLLAAGLISYFATRINRFAGSVVTVAASVAALLLFLFSGDGLASGGSLGMISFQGTPLGWFFGVVILLVYSMTAISNPFWMKKLIYPAAYNMLFLFSLAGTLGVFLARDFLVFFIFWEIAVWASMFIIAMGKSRKASVVYYAMSVFGSFLMLYAIFLLYTTAHSFEIKAVLASVAQNPRIAVAAFVLFLLSGMVKLGIFPFHIWLPMAQGDAPDVFSGVLAGGLEKLGAFAAILVVALLPIYEVLDRQPTIQGIPVLIYAVMILAGVGIVVGTLMAIKQDDVKRLLAYSSAANGGYILIGILLNNQMAMSGALVFVFAHAVAAAAAFLAVAAVAYRTGTTKMSELGGLIHRMPVTFMVFLVAILSLVGVPPMVGFISKWLIFQSLATKGLFFIAAAAFFGSIGAFLYVFRPLSAIFLGQLQTRHKDIREAPLGMLIPMGILSAVSVFFGIMPGRLIALTAKIEASLGFENIIESNRLVIQGSNGELNATLITAVFGVGLVIALVIFLLAPKSRKVDLMDTYTAGEFIYTPELYHYGADFYAPLERLYQKHPSVLKLFEGLAQRVRDLGRLIRSIVFSPLPSRAALLIVVAMILLMWGEKL